MSMMNTRQIERMKTKQELTTRKKTEIRTQEMRQEEQIEFSQNLLGDGKAKCDYLTFGG